MRRRTAAGLAAAGLLTAGAVAQKRLLDSISGDPEDERLRRPLGGDEQEIRGSDGNRLHVVGFGPVDAPKLLLVHGWMCTVEFWRYQIDELAGDFRVIAFDQRGHGRSGAATDYDFDSFADDFGCVLDAVAGPDERVLAAGHSMGAMTIAAWAGRYAGDVERRLSGCLLASTGLGDLITQSVVLKTPERLTGLRDPLGRLLMGAELPMPAFSTPLGDAAVRYVAMSPGASPAQVAFVRRMVLSSNPKARGAAGRSMARMDLWHALESLVVPTTIVTGVEDKMTPPALAHRLADALPNLANLIELPGAGHMAPIEAPSSTNQAIRDLADHAPRDEGAGAMHPPSVLRPGA